MALRFSRRRARVVTGRRDRERRWPRRCGGRDRITSEREWRGSTRLHRSFTLSCRSIERSSSLHSRLSTWRHTSTRVRVRSSRPRCTTGRAAENYPTRITIFYRSPHERRVPPVRPPRGSDLFVTEGTPQTSHHAIAVNVGRDDASLMQRRAIAPTRTAPRERKERRCRM